MSLVSLRRVTKYFGEIPIVKGFSLNVEAGQFVALIGPSGCGKSTLFDLLIGALPRDEGTILWQDKSVDDLSQNAAWMSQEHLLLPWLSLLENAMLPIRRPSRNDRERALSLLSQLGLQGVETYRPDQVSGGMRQRCALARTLLFERKLLLLDEPLSALDALTRQGLQELLTVIQRDFAKSIVMITHDVEEALITADRLLVLSRSPMTVLENLSLTNPKPRHRDSPTIVSLRRHIMDRLQREGTLR